MVVDPSYPHPSFTLGGCNRAIDHDKLRPPDAYRNIRIKCFSPRNKVSPQSHYRCFPQVTSKVVMVVVIDRGSWCFLGERAGQHLKHALLLFLPLETLLKTAT